MFVMSCLDDFRVTTGVEVPVFKFFGVGSPKAKAAAESESKKCDSAHLLEISENLDQPQQIRFRTRLLLVKKPVTQPPQAQEIKPTLFPCSTAL